MAQDNLTNQITRRAQGFKSSALTAAQSRLIQSSEDLVTPLSLNTLNLKVLIKQKFDILHIHAFYNFLNISTINELAKTGIPIFITLHDQRLITGGCHYSRDCSQYQKECKACPQTRKIFQSLVSNAFRSQVKLMEEHQNIKLISPSMWLAKICRESVVAKNKDVKIVHNPIPDMYFADTLSSTEIRKRDYIGFSAANLTNPYKGVQVFAKAINELNEISREKISVLLIGEGQTPDFSPDIQVSRAQPKTDYEMIEELKKLRTLVVSSTQDNSPSVVLEALAMGIPVLGSNVGGIPEILKDFQLPIFEVGNFSQLAALLNESIPPSITSRINSIALQKFSEKIIAQRLLEIYSGKN